MQRVAKILPLPVETKAGDTSMRNALAEKGYNRFPGTGVGRCPARNGNTGEYFTGLNPNSQRIKVLALTNPEEAKRQAAIIKERKERLEAITGLDLGPRSRYYADVWDNNNSELGETASRVKLIDGENVFNFANPHKEIEFWWLSELSDLIAPSLEDWKAGKCKNTVQFYISDPGAEAAAKYQKNMSIVSAQESAKAMDDVKLKKVAKLMGLPVTDTDDRKTVFNEVYTMISEGVVKAGEHKGQNSVELFNRISGLSDKVLNVKSLIREALLHRVYTTRNGVVYEGEQSVARTTEELINDLCLDSKQLELLSLEAKVADKKKMKANIMSYDYTQLPDVLTDEVKLTEVLNEGDYNINGEFDTVETKPKVVEPTVTKPKRTPSAETLRKMAEGREKARLKKLQEQEAAKQ